jgi:cytochrome c oxidase subunit II
MKRTSVICLLLPFGLIVPAFIPKAWAAAETPRRVEITAHRFAFDPGVITLKKGEPVLLILKSSDVPHGIRFKDLGVDLKVSKGGTGQVQFTPDIVGEFVGHCIVFCGSGHGTMILTIHVVS